MAIQISGCTVIDNSRNITNANNMCVGVVTMTGSSGDIETPGTVTVGGLDAPGIISNIFPSNGTTGIDINTNITLSFNFTPPTRGIGTVELREGSTSGTVIESFDASTSPRISVVGNDWILDPTSSLGFSTSIHPIISSTAIVGYVGLNTTGADTYSFTTEPVELGDSYEGGFLICQSGGINWIVAPNTSQVSRTWYNRADSNTRAQQVSGCTGWFVPICGQLQNPGYICRTYWDSFSSATYWSDTEAGNVTNAFDVNFSTGIASPVLKTPGCFPTNCCVRSFRCVTY
jgi:hypothetical protein